MMLINLTQWPLKECIGILIEATDHRPKLTEWWGRVQSRPSFKEAGIVKDPLTMGTFVKKACTIL